MSRCKNQVSQFVPKGFGYKEVTMTCGNTSIHGTTLLCEECEEKLRIEFPQGWRETPGDVCKHGTYVGDQGGIDYICGYCEEGE